MRKSLFIVIAVALISLGAVGGAYFVSKRVCVKHLASSTDDLEWLRQEFKLGEAEMKRVEQLHEGYRPRCQENCSRIAMKKEEFQSVLDAAHGVLTPEAEQKLAEVAALRTKCQTEMLRHFYEVSQVMPADQGRRYLAEMQRLTLGAHDRVEQSMSGNCHTTNGQR